ncbi:alpha-L-rhamnosidase C-terminal domain-containing protein [Flagellimonas meridianipacifica]|uniref:Alpha-L-rhamnosidase-like protein n=1 Tax=Flagellimonas meridianipacifica TaxID=1080225 RepID=A0A2T0M8C8_9FLAO|nr:alpha-L-rhamnosidase C-terminal domain-containing protein [Allomuricauda pacifica]PRX53797.1 alpha-L-rhamnosidase-like protein [Allomuricauda pacifica]
MKIFKSHRIQFRACYLFMLLLMLGSCDLQEETQKQSYAKQYDYHPIITKKWQASWITTQKVLSEKNAWIAFRKQFEVENVEASTILRIAVDSKYWLYLNGEIILFEGGLKRGPTPNDTYYDEVDLSGKLQKGKNTLALLVWYFGKEGMTHKSSGQAGMIAELYQNGQLMVQTDDTWKAIPHPAYISESADPEPNWRLPESNVVFDAREDISVWTNPKFDDSNWPSAKTLGTGITTPWNNLVKRPIPFWKDSGLKAYENKISFPFISKGDTIKCKLPYNTQATPFLKVNAKAGEKITMLTDNYQGGSEYNVRAEYITKEGEQVHESLGWINGHVMYYVIPEDIEVLDLKYRETGYDTKLAGSIHVDDDFYNQMCKKAVRTLYVTMRDNYMDTPGRERAQWWGDVVLESGEAFYALSRSADALMRKGMLELMNWQRPDSTIFSPMPAGNWNQELPGQMLMSIGYYGFWNYYLNTGDLETIKKVHEPVRRYLSLWKLKDDGTVTIRKGGWTWGDWGDNRDIPLLMNTQYYLALKGYAKMSEAIGRQKETDSVAYLMKGFKTAFNEQFWKRDHYRSKDYKGKTDDRSQGLAVVSGLADSNKYEAIHQVLQTEKHASPYMEKYVLEALYKMGYEDFALRRMKERFSKMVRDTTYTTLWEGWGIGVEGFGGGTTNHAWSGGGLTLLYQYAAGIVPTSPGWETFQVRPQPGFLKHISAVVPTVKGTVKVELKNEETYQLVIEVPVGTKTTIYILSTYERIIVNGEELRPKESEGYKVFEVDSGKYTIKAE